MKNLCLVFTLLACTSCDYYDGRLQIHNTTAHSIVVWTSLIEKPEYPSVNHTAYYLSSEVKPGSYYRLVRPGKNSWDYDFSKSYNHKINIIIYDYDTLKKVDNIDLLIEKNLYRTLAISKPGLDSVKWEVAIK
jgi:hypothetical protein